MLLSNKTEFTIKLIELIDNIMDQTTKPLLIPPQFALYAEKNSIFEMYQVNFKNWCEKLYLDKFNSLFKIQ